MKPTDDRNLGLSGLLSDSGSCSICVCRHGQRLLLGRLLGGNGCILVWSRALLLNLIRLAVEDL